MNYRSWVLAAGLLVLVGCSGSSGTSPVTLPPGDDSGGGEDEPPPETASPMMPFVLPFDDDSPGVTDLSGMNHTPAGARGWVSACGEHFCLADERLRFWGVNITDDSSFPSHENAAKVAARLAKFGVNIVRFHHMDYGWSGPNVASLIDYPRGDSRHLNEDNLDRLDYFIYQLREQGIYVNLNLLNSRFFYPADGLPEAVADMDWKESHVLGFVNDTFRDLEKEFAENLLTHTNPYTGLAYADDPAVAMVEINNENSLFQQYYDGAVDAWPTVFREQLQAHWNDWLSERYASTGAMESAWGAISETPGEQMLSNGDFADGPSGWNVEEHGEPPAQVQAQGVSTENGPALRLEVIEPGQDDWHVQLNQGGLDFAEGQLYTLNFSARADTSVSLGVAVQEAYDPWGILESRRYDLEGDWQDFEIQILLNRSDDRLRVNFNGFGNQSTTVYIADVSLRSGGSLGELPEGESLEAGNVSPNRRSEGYPLGRRLDWAAFLRDLEYGYWGDMYDYVKQELGYSGLVAGTTIMNSPPSAQAQYDFADGHAYWQHPVFPGEPWDAQNWSVPNESMVNRVDNPIGGLAQQRLAGLPFTISEYQHASPNTYSSEAPLLIGAYAALQDWDGIMLFDYSASAGDNWAVGHVDNHFNMNAHPTKMANMLIGAKLFRRGDLAASQAQTLVSFDADTELEILAHQGSGWNVANASHLGVPASLALEQRLALDLTGEAGSAQVPAAPNGPVYAPDTDQLRWDASRSGQGVVTVDTERTKAVVGFIDGRTFELGGVRLAVGETEQNWATLAITARHGRLDVADEPASLLMVATGLMENTDMGWLSEARESVGSDWGEAPTLIERIPATVDLPFAAARTQAWALDETGQRAAELTVTDRDGRARLILDRDNASLWYEIVVE